MNPLTISSPVSANDLSTSIRDLAGTVGGETNVAALGPGVLYLLKLPDREPHYFSQSETAFPPAFYKLLDAATTWDEIVVEDHREAYRQAVSLDQFETEARYRIRLNRRGGTLPVVDYRTLIRNESGQAVGVAGRLVDDSFRSVAFDALARRSWKEIATSMTRRYLHDFNNTIAGIYSLSELYAEPGSDPKSTAEAMGHIRDCSVRAQDLTKRIRHLTTLEAGQKSYFDLGSLVEEQKEYMEALLPKGTVIAIKVESGEHPIQIDANRFRQIILHLTSNAADACGEDAAIQIHVSQTTSDGRACGVIEFSDNGPGFKSEDLENATTAFYTTKGSDNHPGLGLSIAYNFATELGGSLKLGNNPDKGANIRIVLPLLEREEKLTPPETENIATVPAAATRQAPATTQPSLPKSPPKVLVYTWEDITRHPLLIAMHKAGWDTRIHLEPGQLLLDLLQDGEQLDGVIVFKSALDEKAEPLISELGHARNCEKVALVALGESVDALSVSAKRICGMVASGSSKPSALLNKMASYFN
ncbi:HAMP domain-containing sensor histidine kinase [Pelagicoccus sp. SDUM812002]|uniref:sensor histidine kinase n=1 Tax=Pelagicoccus sp. SDUM812002 TaxID=3041266 RepID=UPI00280E27C7|nr:HAMP domain-containing sensor histidine kinase [Pelagicoccus sp. SDUM812002]MDQ8186452.1 HAMP domain-containing sensor histidine kinase [Pelagicoccus sp. SDUM812002]